MSEEAPPIAPAFIEGVDQIGEHCAEAKPGKAYKKCEDDTIPSC